MVCTEVGEWRERLCAGGWSGVGSFLLFGSIPMRMLFLRVFISQGKNMSFCCCRIITGQPSDRKSEGMYIHVHSAIFSLFSFPKVYKSWYNYRVGKTPWPSD